MSRKKLFVFGDSWTDNDTETAKKIKNPITLDETWSTHCAKALNMKNNNFGLCGVGNWRISQIIMEKIFIENSNPDCVMVLWSEPTRIPFGHWSIRPTYHGSKSNLSQGKFCNFFQQEIERIYQRTKNNKTKMKLYYLFENIYRDYIQQILYVSKILKEKNIPFVMAQAFHPHFSASEVIPYEFFNEVWEKLLEQYNEKIPKNVLGWPFDKNFGGWNVADKLDDDMLLSSNYHPNHRGHLYIAETFLDGYYELYN